MNKPSAPNRLIVDDDDDVVPTATAQPARPTAKPSPTRTPREGGRGPYPGRRQITAHVDRSLFLWIKSISAQTEKPMIEIFEDALSAYVASYAAQKKFGQG